MKTLIHVPMLHSPEDRKRHGDQLGNLADTSNPKIITASNEFWKIVQDRLGQFHPQNSRFYLEGYTRPSFSVLPGTSRLPGEQPAPPIEDKIMTELIKRLGGTVERTEDQALLDEGFALHRELGDTFNSLAQQFERGETNDLDEQVRTKVLELFARMGTNNDGREGFTADRINSTLRDGETGFLFLGGAHDLRPKLLPDIQVELLDERLVEIRKELTESMMEGESEAREDHSLTDGSPEGKF